MSEDELGAWLQDVAHLGGWLCYHQRPAHTGRGWRTALQGDSGFPDWVLVHPDGGLIFAELKADRAPGPRSDQQAWLDALASAAVDQETGRKLYEVYVWRPGDQATIARRLIGHHPRLLAQVL